MATLATPRYYVIYVTPPSLPAAMPALLDASRHAMFVGRRHAAASHASASHAAMRTR